MPPGMNFSSLRHLMAQTPGTIVKAVASRLAYKSQWKPNTIKENEHSLPLQKIGTIAICVHLFFEEFLDNFIDGLGKFPAKTKIFMSVSDLNSADRAVAALAMSGKIFDVRVVPNRGRNFAPFLVEFISEISQFDYVLHIHSKRSGHSKKLGKKWATRLWNSLFIDENLVTRALTIMESDKAISLYYPWVGDLINEENMKWNSNRSIGSSLWQKLGGEPLIEDEKFDFPAGGMFWFRPSHFLGLGDLGLAYDDFPLEEGQIDGTLHHAIERLFGFIPSRYGKKQLRYIKKSDSFSTETYLPREANRT